MKVSDAHLLGKSLVGTTIDLQGLLLGGKDLYIADSIEAFDQGVAIPLRVGILHENLVGSGIWPVAGGPLGYSYRCRVIGRLGHDDGPHGYSLVDIVSMVVLYDGVEVDVF
ncbi:hypothetical protein TA3x_004052 [Tundrisphaera sp. TA3]|uniref:hypothetical protein n=1 Tax=Tundrisphaera sp. TA3 TaxID=3435775 RepID=UPI003EBCE3D7